MDGTDIKIGGWLSAADHKAIMDELRAIYGAGCTIAEHGIDNAAEYITASKNKALAPLTAIESAFAPEAFINAMNLAVINFATRRSVRARPGRALACPRCDHIR